MTSRTRAGDLDPLSPELVLVSSPELAELAREQLSSPPAAVAEREQLPSPTVAQWEPDEDSTPADEASAGPRRPMPPPYPRPEIVQPAPEPERRRRSRTRALAVVAGVAALATAGVAAALAWGHLQSTQKDARAPLLPPSEAQVTPQVATGSPAKSPRVVPARPQKPRTADEKQPKPAAKPPKPATKPASKSRQPAPGAGVFVPGRTWSWSTSKGASAYVLRFFRNGREVFKARTAKTRMVLPRSFRFTAGRYRWTVQPASGPPSKRRYGPAIVDSSFVLTTAVAARANRG